MGIQTERKMSVYAVITLFIMFNTLFLGRPTAWADEGMMGDQPDQTASDQIDQDQASSDDSADSGAGGSRLSRFRESLKNQKGLEIHPRFGTEYELDDNIFLTDTGKKTDSIFTETVGIGVKAPFGNHRLKFDYDAKFLQFADRSNQNTQDQSFGVGADMKFTNAYLNVNEKLARTTDRAGTTFTERVPRVQNTVDAILGYKWNRLTLENEYENFVKHYQKSTERSLDYNSNSYSTRAFVDITPKVQIFPEYKFTHYDYERNQGRDGNANAIAAGIRGELLPKTTLFSKFGYEHVSYDGAAEPDVDSFITEIGAGWTPREKTKIDFGWTRTNEQSTFSTANSFVQNLLYVNLKQRLTEKITFSNVFAWTQQDYNERVIATSAAGFTGERKDSLIDEDIELAYLFTEWLNGYIRYQFSHRDSQSSLFDYVDNKMIVGMKLEL